MKKTIIILGLLFLYEINAFSQEKEVSMQLLSITNTKDEIKIKFQFTNNSEKDIAIYSLTPTDICRNFFEINFISIKDSTIHTYKPCDWIADAELIKLDCKNSIILAPKEAKILNMNLHKKRIFPFLVKNISYNVFLKLYLKDNIGKSVFPNYFAEDILSNYLTYNN